MSMIEDIKRDRGSHTYRWCVCGDGNRIKPVPKDEWFMPIASINHEKIWCDNQWVDIDRTEENARRIARVPDMEAALLAAEGLADAVEEVEARSTRTYTANDGKQRSFEADDGEACEIVHSDAMHQLREAVAAYRAAIGGAA